MFEHAYDDWLRETVAEDYDEGYTDYGLQCPNCQEYATELTTFAPPLDNRWRCSWCKSDFDEAQSSGRYNRSHQYQHRR